MQYKDLNPDFLEKFEAYDDHECVRRFETPEGVVGFVAVHNTNLGPAVGGCRMHAYVSEEEALTDVLRLSRGMTYKNAVADLPLGGGKTVIIGNPYEADKKPIMQTVGQVVDSLEGQYITAEDSGTSEEDMVIVAQQTPYVTGLPPEKVDGNDYGELGGNPSPLTALGCYEGIKAAVAHRYKGERQLSDLTVAVQGIGAVGLELCKLLKQDGVKLIITDVSQDGLKRAQGILGEDAEIVAPDAIYEVQADIFAPCALGGVLNDETIERLRVDIIAGASNNQLLKEHHDRMLFEKNILYVPDYVINAGGIICAGYELFRRSGVNSGHFELDRKSMVAHVERTGQAVTRILKMSKEEGIPPGAAADLLAEEKFLESKPANDTASDTTSEDPPSYCAAGGTTMVH